MAFWLLVFGVLVLLWWLCIAVAGPIAIIPLAFATLCGAIIMEES